MSEVDEEMIISLAQQFDDADELKNTIAQIRPEWPGWQPAWATEDHLAEERFEYATLRRVRIADDLDWESNRSAQPSRKPPSSSTAAGTAD